MKLFVKIAPMGWRNASRDKRELEVAREAGYELLVVTKTNNDNQLGKTEIDGFPVHCLSTRPFAFSYGGGYINRVFSFFNGHIFISRLNAEILSCHDLIALGMGYLSYLGKKESKVSL